MRVSFNRYGGKFDGSVYDFGPWSYKYMPPEATDDDAPAVAPDSQAYFGHYWNGRPMWCEPGATDNEVGLEGLECYLVVWKKRHWRYWDWKEGNENGNETHTATVGNPSEGQ